MTDECGKFGITGPIGNAGATPLNCEFMADYIAHVRRVMATTQREIDEAIALHPELRDIRL